MTIISAKVSSSSPAAAAAAARPSKVIAIDASTPRAAPKKPSAAPKLVAALAAVAVAAFSPAAPAFAGDLVLGAKVFSNTCATCHSGGQNILEADKTLEREALEQYLDGGFSEASIVKQVTNGKGSMPAWGGQLSPEEINAVASYVYDQASGDKW